jgi:hypothetical protein
MVDLKRYCTKRAFFSRYNYIYTTFFTKKTQGCTTLGRLYFIDKNQFA